MTREKRFSLAFEVLGTLSATLIVATAVSRIFFGDFYGLLELVMLGNTIVIAAIYYGRKEDREQAHASKKPAKTLTWPTPVATASGFYTGPPVGSGFTVPDACDLCGNIHRSNDALIANHKAAMTNLYSQGIPFTHPTMKKLDASIALSQAIEAVEQAKHQDEQALFLKAMKTKMAARKAKTP